MIHYIDKDAVAAEIRRMIKNAALYIEHHRDNNDRLRYSFEHQRLAMCELLSFIDTLEVKEVDLDKDVRQIIDLYLEAGRHYDDVIKKERNMYGYSDLAIKLLDRTADAKEMSIQYVLDKLRAQKGEKI